MRTHSGEWWNWFRLQAIPARITLNAWTLELNFSSVMTIRQETSPQILHEVFRLRAMVWRELSGDSQFYKEEWTDQFDALAFHWVAIASGRVVAAARMTIHSSLIDIPDFRFFSGLDLRVSPPIAAISRLVVHPEFRGRGLSRQLDDLRLDAAVKMECRSVTVTSSKLSGIRRLHSLQKRGFVAVAPIYSFRDWDLDWVTPMLLEL